MRDYALAIQDVQRVFDSIVMKCEQKAENTSKQSGTWVRKSSHVYSRG